MAALSRWMHSLPPAPVMEDEHSGPAGDAGALSGEGSGGGGGGDGIDEKKQMPGDIQRRADMVAEMHCPACAEASARCADALASRRDPPLS